ncbi:hypothetical protein SPURM210S_04334 [Streptomyces purpurascens]
MGSAPPIRKSSTLDDRVAGTNTAGSFGNSRVHAAMDHALRRVAVLAEVDMSAQTGTLLPQHPAAGVTCQGLLSSGAMAVRIEMTQEPVHSSTRSDRELSVVRREVPSWHGHQTLWLQRTPVSLELQIGIGDHILHGDDHE